MNDEPCFIYYNARQNRAWPETSRNDLGDCVLLFTCPESWLPETQEDFNAAAEYYGVKRPNLINFQPGLVPF